MTLVVNDLSLGNVLIDEKYYQNILIYNIPYKTPNSVRPLYILFDQADGYITNINAINI